MRHVRHGTAGHLARERRHGHRQTAARQRTSKEIATTGNDPARRTGTITKLSPWPVDETVPRLTAMITEKGTSLAR
jgi:hypothetical protein